MANFNQENMYKTLSELASFCKKMWQKHFDVFWFIALTAVHLQNMNAKFHKVG